jgi:hypothetical protein
LRTTTYEYLVPLAATNGQCGGFLRTGIGPRLVAGQRVGYLGDQDLCGGQIEANTRRVLEELVGELDWQRIAITEQQVRDHDLPVIQKPDNRYSPPRVHEAVETEALGQTFIVRLVREWLDAQLPEPLDEERVREDAQREQMRAALNPSRPSSCARSWRAPAAWMPASRPFISKENPSAKEGFPLPFRHLCNLMLSTSGACYLYLAVAGSKEFPSKRPQRP